MKRKYIFDSKEQNPEIGPSSKKVKQLSLEFKLTEIKIPIYYNLNDAKKVLHDVIETDSTKRIYQIGILKNLHFDEGAHVRFVVGTPNEVFDAVFIDDDQGGIHTNVAEYFFGHDRCPLVFDVEWYNPLPVPRENLFDTVKNLVELLVFFISEDTIREDDARITVDDVCVEEACYIDGRKASFHIKVPSLVFPSMAYDMKNFVYYFCTWLYKIRADIVERIPEIFFYQNPSVQAIIKNVIRSNESVDIEDFMVKIKEKCEEEWERCKPVQYACCGVDAGIYRNGSALRVAGACKPNMPGETPRFLRPCLVTGWWKNAVDHAYLDDDQLNASIPSKQYRKEWARASLMLVPVPAHAVINVPAPKGAPWKKMDQRESEHITLPPPPPLHKGMRKRNSENDPGWRWVLNVDNYTYPVAATWQPTQASGSNTQRQYHNSVNDDEGFVDGDGDDDIAMENDRCFIYVFTDREMTRYERRDNGEWYDVTRDTDCPEVGTTFRRAAYRRKRDGIAQYWNNMIEIKRAELAHMEAVGYRNDKTDDTAEAYSSQSTELQSRKQIIEWTSVRYLDDRTRDMLFSGPNVTLDARFELVTNTFDVVKFGDIIRHTVVFCPGHEFGDDVRTTNDLLRHSPSAWVEFDHTGRRFLSCSICNASGGKSVRETWLDYVGEERWEDLHEEYGPYCVKFDDRSEREGKERYYTLEDLLWKTPEDGEREERLSYTSRNKVVPYPHVYIGNSPMGSGKTTLLNRLADDDLASTMKQLGYHAMEQPSILSISPRRDLAGFTAEMLGLMEYYNDTRTRDSLAHQGVDVGSLNRDEILCKMTRLAICINSLRRLTGRHEGYDIVIMDEYATTTLSMISKLMLSYVAEVMELLETIIRRSKIVILLAADGTPRMAKTLLPFLDWNNHPENLKISNFKGGFGGISDHDLYVSDDLFEVSQVLKKYVNDGKNVYVPTNRKSFAERLKIFCENHLGLTKDEIEIYHAESDQGLKKQIARDPEDRLGFGCLYCRNGLTLREQGGVWRCNTCHEIEKEEHRSGTICIRCGGGIRLVGGDGDDGNKRKTRCDVCKYVSMKPYPKIRVFIASPAFGVGFSVKGGYFDATIGFFFTLPQTVQGNVQHLARIRGVTERVMFCYYESRLTGAKHYSRKNCNAHKNLEKAISSYEDLLESTNHAEFRRLPDGPLRSYAIYCEVQTRLSLWYGDAMFIDAVSATTGTTPYSLKSWICGKGNGPIVDLSELTDVERDAVTIKKGSFEWAEYDLNTWTDMEKLYAKNIERKQKMETDEVTILRLFEELPVPYGLFDKREREMSASLPEKLDHLWRAMTVLAFDDVDALTRLDVKKYHESQGVSSITRNQRYHQQYQLFNAWAYLIVPCLPDAFRVIPDNAGNKLLMFIANRWRVNPGEESFVFELYPVGVDFELAVDEVNDMVPGIKDRDGIVDDWLIMNNVNKLKEESNGNPKAFRKMYGDIVRRGFRQFLGMKYVGIECGGRKDYFIRVEITDLRRLVLLACIRRINLSCNFAISFCKEKFSVISEFRQNVHLRDLVPTDVEISQACGMDV